MAKKDAIKLFEDKNLFHEKMPFDYLDLVFQTIEQTPQHQYQILTKRAHILDEYCKSKTLPENVWLGEKRPIRTTNDRTKFVRIINKKS